MRRRRPGRLRQRWQSFLARTAAEEGSLARAVAVRALVLVWPGGLMIAAGLTGLAWAQPTAGWAVFHRVFPWVVYGLAAGAGWIFNRTRVVYAAAALALTGLGTAQMAALPAGQAAHYTQWANLLLIVFSLNIVAVARFDERGVLSWAGARRMAALGLQAAVVAWLCARPRPLLGIMLDYQTPLWPWRAVVGQLPLAIFTLALVTLAARFIKNPAPLEAGLVWTLGAVYLALGVALPAAAMPSAVALGGAALLAALVLATHALAFRDELTGLPSRRALEETLARLGPRYTLAMADIDHFKQFNDRFGHDVGDQVLRMVAARLAAGATGARVFRYGGEEFTLVFAGREAGQARPILEAVRAQLEQTGFFLRSPGRPAHPGSTPPSSVPAAEPAVRLPITISIGLAPSSQDNDPQDVLRAADQALYRAKQSGRNRVSD